MNKQMNERFLECEVKSESTRKSYKTLFDRIESIEKVLNKDVVDWSSEDIRCLLENIGSKKFNTLCTKFSLVSKYLKYIDNNSYKEISIEDLKQISEENEEEYIPVEIIRETINNQVNPIDRCLLILMRCYGVRGDEIRNIKIEDIDMENKTIKLPNGRIIKLTDEDFDIIKNTVKTRSYTMNISEEDMVYKRIVYTEYDYNMDSEYLWKNRPSVNNNNGLDNISFNGANDRISRLLRSIKVEGYNINAINMITSYIVDEIIKIENLTGVEITENQVKKLLNKFNISGGSMYRVYKMKEKVRKRR